MLEAHHRVSQQHTLAGAGHNVHKFLVLLRAEAHNLATVADWLGNTIWAAVNLGHNGGQKGSTLWTKLVAAGVVMLVAIYTEGLFNIGLFLGNSIFYLRLSLFGSKSVKNAHLTSPFMRQHYAVFIYL